MGGELPRVPLVKASFNMQVDGEGSLFNANVNLTEPDSTAPANTFQINI
jgi:hypothetical protein